MSEELKEFGINLEDIEESNNLFDNIQEAINKMMQYTLTDRFEVVLNNNLIETKEKLTNYRIILGCRISYDNLDKNISFIVREDNKPTYEELENQLQEKDNIIKDIKAQLDYLETYSSKEDVFEDMKRRLDRIEKIIDKENKYE